MPDTLLSLPLPILAFVLACVACALTARVDFGRPAARAFFMAFFALIALGTLFVGLRFGYGVESLTPLQRCLPLFGGPLLYLGFCALCVASDSLRKRALLHLGTAVLISLAVTLFLYGWNSLDLAIGVSYLVYGILLLRLWRKGADQFALARLEIASSLPNWALWGAIFLIVSLFWDTAIAVSFALERSESAVSIISYASFVLLAFLLVAIISVASKAEPKSSPNAPQETEDDTSVEAAARDLLNETKLYLDTELSLVRLAKRMHIPARALSSAINTSKGMNVSQYVNGFRVDHAAKLLRESDLSVTKIAEASGFLTRSNFYREFQRVHGVSPANYRKGG